MVQPSGPKGKKKRTTQTLMDNRPTNSSRENSRKRSRGTARLKQKTSTPKSNGMPSDPGALSLTADSGC